MQLIPPTKAALEERVKRAVYQDGHAWGQMLLPAPELLHQPTGVGQGLEKGSTHLTGPGYLRQLTAALSWFLASARNGVCEALQVQKGCPSVHSPLCV